MTVHAKIRVDGVLLVPKPAANAVQGELFADTAAPNQISVGAVGGTSNQLASGANPLVKLMQNLSGATILANAEVAKLPNGGIAAAGSDTVGRMNVIGIAKADILNNAIGSVGLFGPNQEGVLTGTGFAPGDKVYMAESNGAYTNDLNSFSGGNDRIVRVGIADCAAGTASATVVDLLCVLTEEVADVA